jgi:hypothetical protein
MFRHLLGFTDLLWSLQEARGQLSGGAEHARGKAEVLWRWNRDYCAIENGCETPLR